MIYFPARLEALAPETPGENKNTAQGRPAQCEKYVPPYKKAEIEYEKGTLANKDGMSYNIPCGNGLEAVV